MAFTKETEWNKLPIILKLGLAESIAKKGTTGGATSFLLSSKSEMRLGIRTSSLYCNELLSCAKKRELALLLILHVEVKSRVFLQSFANKTALVMATLIFCQETPQAEKEIWHQFSEWYLVPATIYWGRRASITWKCSFGGYKILLYLISCFFIRQMALLCNPQ